MMRFFKHAICIVTMIILAGNVRAVLWDPPVLNPGFESPYLGYEVYGFEIDDWYDVPDDAWDAWIEYATGAGGNGIPISSDPNQWAGLSSNVSSFYQQIGIYSGSHPIEVNLYLAKRINRTFFGITMNLRVGGDPATAADDVSLDTVGASIVDTVFFTGGLDLLEIVEMGAAEVTETLDIPSGFNNGQALWIEFVGGGGQFQYFDDVRITFNDNDPPVPDPMEWATPPYATGSTSIMMTAVELRIPVGAILLYLYGGRWSRQCVAG